MKKPKFSLQNFEGSDVKTLGAEELNLVIGAASLNALCSNSGDSDSQSENCSLSDDKDDQSSELAD